MKSKSGIQIPSEEDFARANRKMRELEEGFRLIRESVLSEFKERAPIHSVWLFPNGAYVFYPKNSDIELCKDNGTSKALKEYIELEFKNKISATCEVNFDSHENVLKQYNGNYYKYFR